MKRLISIAIISCCAGSAFAADTPVIEAFGCKLTEGKTMADFDRAAAAWAAQADALPENRNYFAAILQPFRGFTQYDVVWIGSNPSVSDWALANAAGMASASEQAALAALGETATCESSMFMETALFEGLKDEPGDNDALLESYACNLNPGKTRMDAEAMEATFLAATKAVNPGFSTYRWTPFVGRSTYQVVYLTVNDDFNAFAAATSAFNNSKEGQASNAAAAATFRCDSALWLGRVLHQPAAPANP
jgi:hypothetical protein